MTAPKNNLKDIDAFIKEHFTASFMSNTKWYKLIEALTDELDQVHLHYKLIYAKTIRSITLDMVDTLPFFIEPTYYKEVEWIAFSAAYEGYINSNNLKAGKTTFKQDLKIIRLILEKTAEFETDHYPTSIKLYAYRR